MRENPKQEYFVSRYKNTFPFCISTAAAAQFTLIFK